MGAYALKLDQILHFSNRKLRGGMGLRPLGTKAGTRPAAGPLQSEDQDPSGHAARMLEQYGDSILRLAYSYLHNMSDAEDMVQDTLIQYLKTRPHFVNAAQEKAWFLRVAANLSKNRIRYNQLRETDELMDSLAAEEREDLAFVWEAVKELPPRFSEAIHLFYYEGYSVREIASILHRNESTVRSDLRRGREKLRTLLKEAYDFE